MPNQPLPMAPWDEALWFQNIPATSVTNVSTTGNTQLAKADPMRVGLILAAATVGATVWVRPNGTTTGIIGIPLTTTVPPLMLTVRDWGPLVQQEWGAAASGAGAGVYVIEIRMKDWPREPANNGGQGKPTLAAILKSYWGRLGRSARAESEAGESTAVE